MTDTWALKIGDRVKVRSGVTGILVRISYERNNFGDKVPVYLVDCGAFGICPYHALELVPPT